MTREQLDTSRLSDAATSFMNLIAQNECADFLTVPAYGRLTGSNVSKE